MPTSGSPGRVIRQRTARWAREGLESKGQLTHPLEAQLLVFVVRQAALHGLLVHTFHVLVLVLNALACGSGLGQHMLMRISTAIFKTPPAEARATSRSCALQCNAIGKVDEDLFASWALVVE